MGLLEDILADTARSRNRDSSTSAMAMKMMQGAPTISPGGSSPSLIRATGGASGKAGQAIAIGKSLIGTPYSWGGGTINGAGYGTGQDSRVKGFDCSSFVQYVYNKIGVRLPRTSRQQVAASRKISAADARAGDLVYYGSGSGVHHIGIYLGGGQYLYAPQSGERIKTGSIQGSTGFARVL